MTERKNMIDQKQVRELSADEVDNISGAAPKEQESGGTGPYDPTEEMKKLGESSPNGF